MYTYNCIFIILEKVFGSHGANVLLYSLVLTFFQIRFYYVLYFCTVCSVMPFLLVCHSNVFAEVEN